MTQLELFPVCSRCLIEPGYHAGLHVGHIWTNVRCPAYITLNGADCVCAR